jgi:hypothetical protein
VEAAVMARERLVVVVALLATVAASCGGGGSSQPAAQPASQSAAPASETRWLRGLFADDIKTAVGKVGLSCKGPNVENRTNVWMCESGTPLVTYQLTFYGSAPGKIEYLHAVVIQSGSAKNSPPLQLFGALAGLRFDGGDTARAKDWVTNTLESGGATEIGPARYKLAGDANRRVCDIKASGSDW